MEPATVSLIIFMLTLIILRVLVLLYFTLNFLAQVINYIQKFLARAQPERGGEIEMVNGSGMVSLLEILITSSLFQTARNFVASFTG